MNSLLNFGLKKSSLVTKEQKIEDIKRKKKKKDGGRELNMVALGGKSPSSEISGEYGRMFRGRKWGYGLVT